MSAHRSVLLALSLLLLAACDSSRPTGPDEPDAPPFPLPITTDIPLSLLPTGSLVFVRSGPGAELEDYGLSLLEAGREPRSIFSGRSVATGPDMAPDGSRVAFSAYLAGREDLFVLGLDGGAARMVAEQVVRQGVQWNPHYPSWSPNGERLAYSGFEGLTIIDADGSNSRTIRGRVNDLAWSPTGEWLAFATGGLHVIRPDGTGERLLEGTWTGFTQATWSPDGSRIAFVSRKNERGYDLYTIRPDGSHLVRLTDGAGDELFPSWSPDGSSIVFVAGDSPTEWQLFRIGPDGEGLEQLTTGPGKPSYPAWSPDGRWIAFGAGVPGVASPDMYLLDLEQREILRLTSSPVAEGQPTWRPEQ